MIKRSFIKGQSGYTMVEVLVSMLIGVFVVYTMASFLVGLNNINNKLRLRRISSSTIRAYAENIRFDTSLFQVTFNNGGAAEAQLLDPANLPLGISKDGAVVARTDCSTTGCSAYMGYVILPDAIIRNLYQVKFVVVNSSDTSVKWESSYYITVK